MSATKFVLKYYNLPFTLYDKQIEIIDDLAGVSRCGLYLDIGAGKSVVSTMLALYASLVDQTDQILIILPPILSTQWVSWLNEVGITNVLNYKGTPAQRKAMDLSADVVICSYQIFKKDYQRFMDYFRDKRVYVIVDEATAVRNSTTQNYRAVRDLMNTPDKRLALLTGSALSRPDQAYGLISLISPHVYRSARQFKLLHIESVDQWGQPVGFKNLELLRDNLMISSWRLEAHEIVELPEILYIPCLYELEPKHKKLYDQVVEENLATLDDGEVVDGTTPQKLYNAAQRVLLSAGDTIVPAGLELLKEFLEELDLPGSKDKLIVSVNYTRSNEKVTEFLKAQGCNPLQAYGGTGAQQNLKNIERFLNDPTVDTLVINPRSAGYGLNLQGVCRHLMFLEIPITSGDFLQTIGRIYRQGQKDKVIVKIGIANRTIQVELKRRVTRKEDLIQTLLPTKENLRKALYGGE